LFFLLFFGIRRYRSRFFIWIFGIFLSFIFLVCLWFWLLCFALWFLLLLLSLLEVFDFSSSHLLYIFTLLIQIVDNVTHVLIIDDNWIFYNEIIFICSYYGLMVRSSRIKSVISVTKNLKLYNWSFILWSPIKHVLLHLLGSHQN